MTRLPSNMEHSSDPTISDKPRQLLSVVVPAFNEEQVLHEFHRRLSAVLDGLPLDSEVIYVNDGSTDATLRVMQELRRSDSRVAIVDLSRNFGKEIAMSAGLDYVCGHAAVIIDSDLQDPPEIIPAMLEYWREGYDNVYAKRLVREGETFLKKATARMFYRVIQSVSRVRIPEDTGDFRLLSRRAILSLRKLRERHRFMKGLFAWLGYRSKEVLYNRDPRHAGQTKWNYWHLWNLAIEGITSFTIAPLKIATYLGVATAALSFIYAIYMIVRTLVYGNPVAGYPSLLVVILFLGGIQLLALGVIGEYLGRTFNEAKARPLYFINEYQPSCLSRNRAEVSDEHSNPFLVGDKMR